MARGNFSTSLYASLSRTQVEFGGPATFGLEINRAEQVYDPEGTKEPGAVSVSEDTKDPKGSNHSEKGSSFKLGRMIERGCFNYRWPVNEYYLDLHEEHSAARHKIPTEVDPQHGVKEKKVGHIHKVDPAHHVGTCQMVSFAKDRMLYQILRIEEDGHIEESGHDEQGHQISKTSSSSRDFPAQSQVVLTMAGPLWLRSFDAKDRLHDHDLTKREQACSSTSSRRRYRLTMLFRVTNAKLRTFLNTTAEIQKV
jgi:hypothetical protein